MPKENIKKQQNLKKKKGKFLTFITVLLILLLIIAAFGGVFYFIVYNNTGNVTLKYYSNLKKIPVLNLALPEPPDPLNPKYMTTGEIKKQYDIYRSENEALKKQLEDANGKIDEYKAYKDNYDTLVGEEEKKIQDLDAREAVIAAKELQLKELQSGVDESIANGDKDSFKTWFESIEPENAALIYENVIKEQQVDANIRKFAQVYAEMDAAAAARIFEQMGSSKIDMIAETLRAMNKENASKILESMAPDFAANATEKLNLLYKGE